MLRMTRKFVCDFEVSPQVHDVGLNITLTDVFDHISDLKSSCNPGPDGVPSIVIKNCKFTLSLPLLNLFKSSLREGIFPEIWKRSFVIPIFKSGQRNKIDIYP